MTTRPRPADLIRALDVLERESLAGNDSDHVTCRDLVDDVGRLPSMGETQLPMRRSD
jgi:hypothetical protein